MASGEIFEKWRRGNPGLELGLPGKGRPPNYLAERMAARKFRLGAAKFVELRQISGLEWPNSTNFWPGAAKFDEFPAWGGLGRPNSTNFPKLEFPGLSVHRWISGFWPNFQPGAVWGGQFRRIATTPLISWKCMLLNWRNG